MKNILTFMSGMVLMMFALASCDPIEDRDELSNNFNPDNIQLEATQSTPGGNEITLKMKTPGVTGYWDYNINKSYTDEVKNIVYPIPGKATFTFHVTTPYLHGNNEADAEYVTKSIEVQIDKLDHQLPQAYYDLIGDKLQGKTWVFDKSVKNFWYMCPGGDITKYQEIWWAPNNPNDLDGKMTFDLNGAANYSYYASADAAAVKGGSFSFSADFTKFYISGSQKILGNEEPRGNAAGEYNIVKLSSSELILYVPTNGGGTGWCWFFKPE